MGTYIANRRVRGHFYGATVISFDKGGEWSLLRPPTVDIDQQPIICAQVRREGVAPGGLGRAWYQGDMKRWNFAKRAIYRTGSSCVLYS